MWIVYCTPAECSKGRTVMEHGGPASLLPAETLDRPIDLAAPSFDATEELARACTS
jgi:hypothetical protein